MADAYLPVILSAAKDLALRRSQILRCAQDDSMSEGAKNAWGVF